MIGAGILLLVAGIVAMATAYPSDRQFAAGLYVFAVGGCTLALGLIYANWSAISETAKWWFTIGM